MSTKLANRQLVAFSQLTNGAPSCDPTSSRYWYDPPEFGGNSWRLESMVASCECSEFHHI